MKVDILKYLIIFWLPTGTYCLIIWWLWHSSFTTILHMSLEFIIIFKKKLPPSGENLPKKTTGWEVLTIVVGLFEFRKN